MINDHRRCVVLTAAAAAGLPGKKCPPLTGAGVTPTEVSLAAGAVGRDPRRDQPDRGGK